jgi:hypothetical protein
LRRIPWKPGQTGLEKMCLAKQRFSDEPGVRAAAQIQLGYHPKQEAIWVYPCENCRGWHITNNRSGSKRRVTRELLYPLPDEAPDGVPMTPQFGGYWADPLVGEATNDTTSCDAA